MVKKTKKQKFEEFKVYFPDLKDEHDYFNVPHMEELIKSSGCDVIGSLRLGSWSGDVIMVLRANNKFGLLVFGYGSCSGCDALQACDNYKELFDLRENRYDSVVWKEYEEFVDYLKNKDWETEFYCAGDKKKKREIKQFVKEVKGKILMSHLSGI